MTKFNQVEKVKTYEGGDAYRKPIATRFMQFLFASYLQANAYESEEKRISQFEQMTHLMRREYGVEAVAKLCLYARNEMGMRSASHLVAAFLDEYDFKWKKDFYTKVFRRPDDIPETLAAIDKFTHVPKSHALMKGVKQRVSEMTEYQFGKYNLKNSNNLYNWFDIINLSHAHSSCIDRIKRTGKFPVPDTWETALSRAKGKNVDKEWTRLVLEQKLGYLALIRNIRNICTNVDMSNEQLLSSLVDQLTNEEAIHKSLVFPYQIYSAYKAIARAGIIEAAPALKQALAYAFDVATSSIPYLDGSTLVLFDVSGSMLSYVSNNSCMTYVEASACMAEAIYDRAEHVDVVKFGTRAKKLDLRDFHGDNVFDIIQGITKNDGCGHSTDIAEVFRVIGKDAHYDRVFIFSDEQIVDSFWFTDDVNEAIRNLADYVYSYDLAGYGNSCIDYSQGNVYSLAGLSDKLFSLIPMLETKDFDAFVKDLAKQTF